MTLTQRFQIEDILAQDHHGVVFAAVDGETGRHVALRRFFPFGSDGGGLQPEERAAYDIGVKRLAEVVHPALRAVVTGGCDPVDGMPFLVTEWVEGSSLSKLLQQGSLTVESAIVLMDQALEVSELLSQVLAEDEVWVETAPSAIVVGGGESDRGITFWISPFRWLSTEETRPGLMPLVELLDAAMGWQGASVKDETGGGLGSWRNWLQANARKATLAEARAALASSTKSGPVASSSPAAATTRKVPPAKPALAHRPMLAAKPQTSWVGKAVIAVLVISALVLGGLLYVRNQKEKSPAVMDAAREEEAAQKRESSKGALGQVNLPTNDRGKNAPQAKETSVQRPAAAIAADEPEKGPAKVATSEAKPSVFGPDDFEAILKLEGKVVTLEGTIQEVHLSDSKKTLFLNLKVPYDRKWASGEFTTTPENSANDRKWMDALAGKEVRITGEVANRFGNPRVVYTNPADVQVLAK